MDAKAVLRLMAVLSIGLIAIYFVLSVIGSFGVYISGSVTKEIKADITDNATLDQLSQVQTASNSFLTAINKVANLVGVIALLTLVASLILYGYVYYQKVKVFGQ